MFQVIGQYGDITFCASTDSNYSPDIADDMARCVRRALVTACAQLVDMDEETTGIPDGVG